MQIDFDQYVDDVYRFALSLTRDQHKAEDLTQECFYRACKKKTQLLDQAKIKAWLFRILHNLWKDQIKKSQNQSIVAFTENAVTSKTTPETTTLMREQHQIVFELMQTLPDQQRKMLFLSVVEQFKNREIAEMLGTTENNVKATISIAKKTIRQQFTSQTEKARPSADDPSTQCRA